ncbi:MAG: PASTA domain-containing protein [Spirochaetes bacterium]|nr:PASTA domain-containing protein [Spirochaetota bacterium]
MDQEPKTTRETGAEIPKSFYYRTLGRIALIFFLGFSVFLFISTLILIFLTKPEGEVEVPNVIGKRYIEVSNTLVRRDLRPQISFENVYDIENGIILSQNPDPGSIIISGSRVHLTVSRSNLFVEVPNVVGLELPFALNKLKNQHVNERSVSLPIGVISYIPSEKSAENIVIDQSPKPGEKITLERKMNLLISAGKVDEKMEMPDVTGQSIELCFGLIAAKGVSIAQNVVAINQKELSGLVTSQNPGKGAKINKGDKVALNVNYYKMDTHPYVAYEHVNYIIPSDEKAGPYEAYVEDNTAKKLCYQSDLNPGQPMSFVFHRTGNARVSILSNKRVIKVFKFDVD